MKESNNKLGDLVHKLTEVARDYQLSDSQWAARARLPKETLSRLRGRNNCDFSTIAALANAVNIRICIADKTWPKLTEDGRFPVEINRKYEETLLELCTSRSLSVQRWKMVGPHFFAAGLAVMLASVSGFDRPGLLMLAENLSPGISQPTIFDQWLALSPVQPSRFLPMLERAMPNAT